MSSRQLTPAEREAIGQSRARARPVLRAATVASVSGWTLAAFGVMSVSLGIFSVAGLLLGVGLLACARFELREANALRRFEIGAPGALVRNQCVLCAMLVVYSAWMLFRTLTAEGPYADAIASGGQVAEMLEPIADLHVLIAVLLYSALAVGAVVGTGCTALYYMTRRAQIERYLRGTPEWVVEASRLAA